MGPFIVVEVEVLAKAASGLSAVLIGFQIYLFVLHRPPQPLDEQIVVVASFTIHADSDPMLLQEPRESFSGKLGAPVGVEYLWLPLPERVFEGLDAETGIEGV